MVDKWVKKYGFANRSELFRSILRFLDNHPDVLKGIAGYKINLSSNIVK